MRKQTTNSALSGVERTPKDIPEFEKASFMPALRKAMEPEYPGAPSGSRDRHSALLSIWWKKTPVSQLLKEFAARPVGTAEFSKAEPLRAVIRSRVIDGLSPRATFDYLYRQRSTTLYSPQRKEMLLALAVFELEHLPQHLAFYEKFKDVDWLVRDYTPRKLVGLLTSIATAEQKGTRQPGQYHNFARDIRRAIVAIPTPTLKMAIQSGPPIVHGINYTILDLAIYENRKKFPTEAQDLALQTRGLTGCLKHRLDFMLAEGDRDPRFVLYLLDCYCRAEYLDQDTADGMRTFAAATIRERRPELWPVLKDAWGTGTRKSATKSEHRDLIQSSPKLSKLLAS